MSGNPMGKVVYWGACVLLIVGLFALIFGSIGFFLKNGLDHVKIFSILFSVLGLIMVVIAIHRPGLAWRIFLKGSKDIPQVDRSNRLMFFMLGLSFVIGGLLYAYTGNISAVIGAFFVFAVVNGILR